MKLNKMLPFLEKEDLDELVEAILENKLDDESISIMTVVPFLESGQVKKIFERALAGDFPVKPVSLLPFLEDDDFDTIVEKIQAGTVETITIEEIMPFLSRPLIQKLFRDLLDKSKQKDS